MPTVWFHPSSARTDTSARGDVRAVLTGRAAVWLHVGGRGFSLVFSPTAYKYSAQISHAISPPTSDLLYC